jgi:hypothetical protein
MLVWTSWVGENRALQEIQRGTMRLVAVRGGVSRPLPGESARLTALSIDSRQGSPVAPREAGEVGNDLLRCALMRCPES